MTSRNNADQTAEAGGLEEAHLGRPSASVQWLHLIYAAAAYFIAAQLARAVVPNDLAAPLWPASGLALGALLVWGGRCWAGVWLGALVSTLARPYGAVGDLGPWTQVAIATLVATAATVQAVAGARLTHRFLIPAVPLATAGSVLRFLLLAGPVSGVVAASVAVPVLLHYGGLAAGAPYMQWLTWWAGDTMGILLVTPLVLAAASGPRVRRHWRVAQIAIPLLVIGALLATAHFWLDRYERSEAREAAVRDMTQTLDIAVSQLPLDIGELYGVERYLASSREVTQEEFEEFTTRLLAVPSLQVVEWAPRVAAQERQQFEIAAGGGQAGSYRIWSLHGRLPNVQSTAERASEDFYPVLLVAPREGGHLRIGLDHASDPLRGAAMARARDAGVASSTCASVFLQTQRPAVFVFVPVYRTGFRPLAASQAARREALRGYVVGAFDLESVLAPLAREAGRRHLTYRVQDVTPGEPAATIAGALPDAAARTAAVVRDIDFFGRLWRIELHSTLANWQTGTAGAHARLLLACSILAALLVALTAVTSAGHAAAIGVEVAARTEELRQELSARIAAERAARLSEESLATTLDSIGDGVFVTDTARRITRMNPVAEQLTGWTHDEAVGRPIEEVFVIVGESHGRAATIPVDAVLATGAIQNLANHTMLVARDGTRRSIADSAAPVRDATGRMVGVVLVFRDVSEERATARALEESEARHRKLIEIAPYGVFVQCEGRFALLNPQALAMLGARSEAELVGRPVLDFVHPESRVAVRERIRTLNEQGRPVPPLRERWLRLDGTVFYGEATGVPYEHQGRPGALVMLRDLAAETQRDRFFDLSLDLLGIVGIDGHFKALNPAFTEVLGYGIDELLATPIAELVHPEDRESSTPAGLELFMGGETRQFINRFRSKDDSWRWLSWRARPYPEEGLLYCSARDVTESLQVNEDLRSAVAQLDAARLEAERANRAKSEFLATMSHEIRTPMNGVIGMVDVLHQTSLRGYQVEMVDLIRESALALLGIIDDILDFSKIEAGRLELERAPLSLADVVRHICGLFDHLAIRKGVEFTVFVDPAIPAQVLGDSVRVRQVLMNLLSNAIKFCSGGGRSGRVSMRATVAERAPGRAVVQFMVTDNGIGMNEESLARLFTPFSQADVSTTRRFGGTGLGLTISHHLLQMMGGTIDVQSRPGEGTTFTVTLPFTAVEDSGEAARRPSVVAGLHCLVVGREDGIARDLRTYLEHAGAEVVAATDLEEARRLAEERPEGEVVWIIDADGERLREEGAEALRLGRSDRGDRYMVIGRGRRRRPRSESGDLVTVDANALTRRTFIDAVALTAGRMTEEDTLIRSGIGESSTRLPDRDLAADSGRLLLVAEDNEINQRVIERQLAVLGYRADIARDGREALERWDGGRYALLLTDLHMPNMDGYDLARTIRMGEGGGRRMPIVALTANAVRGEAERCRAAGMDDYLSKPVSLANLRATLQKWLPPLAEPAAAVAEASAGTSEASGDGATPVVDVTVLAELIGEDPVQIAVLLAKFRESAREIGRELCEACAERAAERVAFAAHTLKSSAKAVGARTLADLCVELERAGRAGHVEAFAELLPRLERALAEVDEFLRSRRP